MSEHCSCTFENGKPTPFKLGETALFSGECAYHQDLREGLEAKLAALRTENEQLRAERDAQSEANIALTGMLERAEIERDAWRRSAEAANTLIARAVEGLKLAAIHRHHGRQHDGEFSVCHRPGCADATTFLADLRKHLEA